MREWLVLNLRSRSDGDRRSLRRIAAVGREQLLDPANRIAIVVEKPVDAMGKRHVCRAIVTAIAGPLERLQLRKACFPIAKDMLRNVEVVSEFADRPESLVALLGSFRHA